MRLREVNYLTQSHTASTWQQHHLEPRLCGSDAGVPNTFTLLPLCLLMKIAVQLQPLFRKKQLHIFKVDLTT